MDRLILRHTLAVVALPLTVVVIIPLWIANVVDTPFLPPTTVPGWVGCLAGAVALLVGGTLFVSCVFRFGREGRGTLAPWDPPARLVVTGPYAYVRNPMISGVILLLVAEGLMLRSVPHLEWAGLFLLANAIYIPLLEEPMLRSRFGKEYETYAKAVPRLVPRLRPWRRDG